MKRFLLLISALLLASTLAYAQEENALNNPPVQQAQNQNELPEVKVQLRESAGVEIPAGIVVPVINMQEVSTETCPVGYKVKFVSTNDLFIGDIKVIPEGTSFYG